MVAPIVRAARLGGLTLAALALAALPPRPAAAQISRGDEVRIPMAVGSGRYDGTTSAGTPYRRELEARDAAWVQVIFGDCDLGAHSYVTLTAARDRAVQRLDDAAMRDWSRHSAYFNGGQVTLELHVAPQDRGVFVSVAAVRAGGPGDPQVQNLCGDDTRSFSTDNRVGRLRNGSSFCTTFRCVNGALITAGHCADFEPDGNLDLGGVVEFNVPHSQTDGTVVAAAPEDQYPVSVQGVRFKVQGLGRDWCVFRVNPNSNTGLLPHQAYSTVFPMRITRQAPPISAGIRLTGCGTDFDPPGSTGDYNLDNYARQSDVGPYLGLEGGGGEFFHEYQTDTMQGTSGSPLIWETENLAIGLHSAADCSPTGGNMGTSFQSDSLEAAVHEFLGPVVTYVDFGTPLWLPQTGRIVEPFDTILEGVDAIPSGGVLSATPASYTVPSGTVITKPMTFVAPVGAVTIGGD